MLPPPPRSTLFPYTTLFRSAARAGLAEGDVIVRVGRENVANATDASRELGRVPSGSTDRKSTRLNSSHSQISYAVFCLKKKTGGRSGSRSARGPSGGRRPGC